MVHTLRYKWFLLKCNWPMWKYKFRHWFFRWNLDEEGDVVFSVAGVMHFIKYKEHTIIRWGWKNYKPAPTHLVE